MGAGACFLDIDGDGRLDLTRPTTSNSPDENLSRAITDGIASTRPAGLPARDPQFVPQQRRRHVHRRERQSGIAARPGTGMGMICADYDNDGHTDIFVSNDVKPNFLFHNNGTGKFEEVGAAGRRRVDINGIDHGNMGVDARTTTTTAGSISSSPPTSGSRDALPEPRRRTVRRRHPADRGGGRDAATMSTGDAGSSISTTTATATCSSSAATSTTTSNSRRHHLVPLPQRRAAEQWATESSSTSPTSAATG